MVSTGNIDAWAFRLAGPLYWYCSIAEHVSFISPSWARCFAADHGISVVGMDRFKYYDEPTPRIATVTLAFVWAAIKRRIRHHWHRLRRYTYAAPMWHLAGPGVFEDHFALAFRKPR